MGINSHIRCHPVDPGTIAWTSRHHCLTVVVPATVATAGDILARVVKVVAPQRPSR